MEKEAGLKKVELKVSVNCCEGCKKKVKKVLQSIEGVLKTEIDSSQPKVTVLGNINPQILIKKLMKAGKQAEIWAAENQKSGKEKKEAESGKEITKDGDNGKKSAGCDQGKCSNSCCMTDKSKEKTTGIGDGDGGIKKGSNKDQNKETNNNSSNSEIKKNNVNPCPPPPPPEANCTIQLHPSMVHDMGNVTSYARYCYMIEPSTSTSTISIPYYMIGSYAAPPPFYGGDHHYYERQPSVQPPVSRVGDYFSDENTVGCYVM